MVEHFLGELLAARVGHIGAHPLGVLAGLVHSDKADGGEVVIEGAEIILRVGIESRVEQLGDDRALRFQTARGQIHEPVESGVEVGLILGEIGEARHVQSDHAD